MSSFSKEKSKAFSDAASNGDLPLVETLARDPEVNLNWQDASGSTAFFHSCWKGHVSIVRILLDWHGNEREPIDFNLANPLGITPFRMACQHEGEEVIDMLLEDWRIDVNVTDVYQRTPLWWAGLRGSWRYREIDVGNNDNRRQVSAAEVARSQGTEVQKKFMESEEGFQQRKKTYFKIASLLESYQEDPQRVKAQLRRELGIDERQAGELFALVVYLADGYLRNRPESQGRREQRFFSIATRLPMELQMVLCNHAFGVADSVLKKVHSERGFRKFASGN